PLLHNVPRDAAPVWLLPEVEEEPGELRLAERVHQVRRRGCRRRIEAHVQRPLAREAEASVRHAQLRRAQTQVDEDAVHVFPAVSPYNRAQRTEVRLDNRGPLSKGSQSLLHRDQDRKSTRLNSSHLVISYAVF